MASIRKVVSKRTGKTSYLVDFRDLENRNKTKTFKKYEDAKRFKTDTAKRAQDGDYLDVSGGRQTFESFAEEWFSVQTEYSRKTRDAMKSRLRKHVYPILGNKRLNQIKVSTIRGWLAGLPLAESTKQVVLSHVSKILQAAKADKLIPNNPALDETITRPRKPNIKIKALPTEVVLNIWELMPEHLRIVVTLGAGLGLRQSELLGLAVEDIDFLRGVVHLRRQRLKLDNNKVIYAPPKGGKAKGERERDIPLPVSVRDALALHLAKYPAMPATYPYSDENGKLETHNLILTHLTWANDPTKRKPIELNKAALNRAWEIAVRGAGLTTGNHKNGMHSLRHYYASVMLNGHVSIVALSEYMGHSSIRETLDTYAHMMPEANNTAIDTMDAHFASFNLGGETNPQAHGKLG